MGIGGISIWQLFIILAIVVILFGTKRLRHLGSDLGTAMRNFRQATQEAEDKGQTIENQKSTTKD